MLSIDSPFSFILFGASGHLAQLKIYPALYTLAHKGRLPEHYNIVGYSRSPMTNDAFRTLVAESIRKSLEEPNEEKLGAFLDHVFYVQGQYDNEDDFAALAKELDALERKKKDTVRVAYLSVPPVVFDAIAHNLCKGGVRKENGKFRCIVEKPVGHDLESFEKIKTQLTKSFPADDVYLLDHYLGKEAVRNVYYLRYANPILERLLKNTLIHHVEITAAEESGIEGRGGYFEHTGTFRDMFQSHLLMVVSLLTMRLREDSESFRQARFDALSQIYLPPAADMNDIVLQGQYEGGTIGGKPVPSYREEVDTADDSRTNTYAALKLRSRMSRWDGVPFYLRSGKRLYKKETRISIVFQEPNTVGEGSTPNQLDIILQGEAGMKLHLQTKLGGTEPRFRPLVMEDPLICFGDCMPDHGLLLLEAIHGREQWFLSFEEVQTAWRLMEPVQTHLDQADTPLHHYPAGSYGPDAAVKWLEQDGAAWVES